MEFMSIHEMISQNYPEMMSVESYPAAKVAAIRGTDEEWGVFGNFWKNPKKGKDPRTPLVVIDGAAFDCTERLFQLMKLKDGECLREVNALPCGIAFKRQMAKILAAHGVVWRDDWPTIIVDAMKFCLQKKYEQSEFFRQELERSRGLWIVEDETKHLKPGKEPLWGARLVEDRFEGPNVLGKLLMELRDSGRLDYSLPADALDFLKQSFANPKE